MSDVWWTSNDNLAALLDWLVDHDRVRWSRDNVRSFLIRPWRWDLEWEEYVRSGGLAHA